MNLDGVATVLPRRLLADLGGCGAAFRDGCRAARARRQPCALGHPQRGRQPATHALAASSASSSKTSTSPGVSQANMWIAFLIQSTSVTTAVRFHA
jgi:hypothetical protein